MAQLKGTGRLGDFEADGAAKTASVDHVATSLDIAPLGARLEFGRN
jgi:hypothetical protein